MGKRISELICQKDEQSARQAARELIQNQDLKEFENLCSKMDFLFDFVRNNVYNRLEASINKNNFRHIIAFFNIYSSYFDDFFASILSKYADEDLTDEILEILSNGNESQKAYCASYFKKIPDSVAKQDLTENLNSEFEPLFTNCAAALGKMEDKISFEKYRTDLSSEDEFEKLKAVKFLVAYSDTTIIEELINTMQKSSMPENIAGEIANLVSPAELISQNFDYGVLLFNHLINGLGEILSLDNIFYYEIFDVLNILIENQTEPQSAVLLFNIKNKFELLTQNDEYIFDLDKNIKNEIFDIKNLLIQQPQSFWDNEKKLLKPLLNENEPFLNTILSIIREENFVEFCDEITELTKSENETLICEAIHTLKILNKLDKIDKQDLNIKNQTIKAIIEQQFAIK